MSMKETIAKGQEYIMDTYTRFPLALSHGEGVYVYDEDGNQYLDFVAGIAVNSLGHNDPDLVAAIAAQAGKMLHVSNLYWTKPQVELAEKLVKHSCFHQAFFCNSGAEAVEGALKMARKYADKKGTGRYEIISMEHSFHGRTMGAVTATGQPKYQKGLSPLLPGIVHVPYNDFEAVKNAVTERTCAILIEPLQGEGGIRPAQKEYLQKLRSLCDELDILLMYDEVQCGMGRTGRLFAYEYFGVAPDVIAMAKGAAGGVPIGILMAVQKAAEAFAPGDHASTFGGNPLATAAANVVLDKLTAGPLLENVKQQGAYLKTRLAQLAETSPLVQEARGIGLLQGIQLTVPAGPIINVCITQGLLLANAGPDVIRFVPPLIISQSELEKGLAILTEALKEAEAAQN